MNKKNIIYIPVSIGELIDKISILQIKLSKIKNTNKLNNINKELKLLLGLHKNIEKKIFDKLYLINSQLWDIEEKIRDMENKNQFDDIFIQTARSVYLLNDERAKVKKEINTKYSSELFEEKSYNE
jgi:hypothetical protein